MKSITALPLLVLVATLAVVDCGGKKPPVATAPTASGPAAFPSAGNNTPPPPPGPPPASAAMSTDSPVTSSPLMPWDAQPLDVINGPDSPMKPVMFAYDSDEIDEASKKILSANADVLKSYKTWVITIEGHCDERGSSEYNLALGDRRALAAKNYLVSLGIGPDRMRTVSYGNEFPFDAAHSEAAYAKNRRAHFMLTSK